MRRSGNLSRLIQFVALVAVLCGVGAGIADGHLRNESAWPRLPGSPATEKIAVTSSGARSNRCLPCASLRAEKIVVRWAWQHFPHSFAGMYIVRDNDLVVGFTHHQARRVRAAGELRGVPPNVKVLPFPYVPAHPLMELGDLERHVWHAAREDDSIRQKIVGVGIDEQANLVDVGAARGQVKALAGLLRARFGQNTPIRVHYEEAPVEV